MQQQGLHRSRKDRVIAGVAGGIAHSLNADPAIIRLIFAILIIVGGGGILLYLILWIAIPEEPLEFFQETGMPGEPGTTMNDADTTGAPYSPPVYPVHRNNGALIVGLILITLGALFLVNRLFPAFRFHFHDFWPVVIVIAGIALILSSFQGNKKS